MIGLRARLVRALKQLGIAAAVLISTFGTTNGVEMLVPCFQELYDKLEHIILPMFYDKNEEYRYVMRNAIAFNASFFNTHRMVQQCPRPPRGCRLGHRVVSVPMTSTSPFATVVAAAMMPRSAASRRSQKE